MADIRRLQSDIFYGAEFRILGQEGKFRVISEQKDYITFLRYGYSELFGDPYEYPIAYHRTDLLGMDLVPACHAG
jgi:hypothetical protein